ncbi:MAG: sensor histidine kinase [Bacteroidia bacterium]
MNSFFRKLPLSIKLMLIGLIPVIFLIYLSGQLYREKRQTVKLIGDYILHVHEEGNISNLIYELEKERKVSYEYALKKDNYSKVVLQRPHTDKAMQLLEKSKDLAVINFSKYTFLDSLVSVRNSLDNSAFYPADAIMQFYTNAIFRLNTLNPVSSMSNTYLQPVYKDLLSQKTLFEMITYLSIIRTNIYNVLFTGKYEVEKLMGTLGVYNIFKSYEKEFLMKASSSSIKLYNIEKDTSSLKPILAYIDKLFSTFKFDSTYSAKNWWEISSRGMHVLKEQQLNLWQNVESGMNKIYQQEIKSRNKTLTFLIAAIILVITFVIYTIRVISQMLSELKIAAQKISVGGTGLNFHNMPKDVMGSLTDSILEIDRNNIELAHAANAIGKGNFNVSVNPRGNEDLLGNSIQKMKEDLHKLTLEKDKVQQETLELMNRKDDFLSIASHELKTPVTSLKAYTQLLQMDAQANADIKRESMLSKMDMQVDKLTNLITDLLDTSKMQNGKLVYNKHFFQLNDLVKEIVDEIQINATAHKIIIEKNAPLQLYGDRERIGQVLSNLLSNAVKYCPDCKNIIVNLVKDDEAAICSVRDFGYGINETQKNKIFERFYRVSGNNLHTYPGLGIGLFIAKEIIERHNGKIWFESEEGKGSIFYFSLPIVESQSKRNEETVMNK